MHLLCGTFSSTLYRFSHSDSTAPKLFAMMKITLWICVTLTIISSVAGVDGECPAESCETLAAWDVPDDEVRLNYDGCSAADRLRSLADRLFIPKR